MSAAHAFASTRRTLDDDSHVRGAATSIGFVVTNRNTTMPFSFNMTLVGLVPSDPAPSFSGHGFGYNVTDQDLGSMTATVDPATGLAHLFVEVLPLSIQFWVQV